jgi:hypothetical protein
VVYLLSSAFVGDYLVIVKADSYLVFQSAGSAGRGYLSAAGFFS